MKTTLFSLFLLSMFTLTSCSESPKPKESTEVANDQNDAKMKDHDMAKDADWMVKIADGNMLEIELGKLAEKNGKMKEVKDFGKMMVEHHTKLGEECKGLAAKKNVTLPAALGDDTHKIMEKLSNLAGHDFDKEYISVMIDDHEKDIKEFESKAEEIDADADLKAWVTASLPILRSHLTEIKAINEKCKMMKK
ncbi:MAG: DUF4142 domain-containing protein [Bacteroidia bacterium]|nr:DUF4142 domain-containing protein [Bacteroidia bacterium]